jgi:hypothetical protein
MVGETRSGFCCGDGRRDLSRLRETGFLMQNTSLKLSIKVKKPGFFGAVPKSCFCATGDGRGDASELSGLAVISSFSFPSMIELMYHQILKYYDH